MKQKLRIRKHEKGATLVEFAIAAGAFSVALFGVLEVSRLLWTYNALANAVRQGARYAILNTPDTPATVKNVVVYGTATPAQNANPLVYGLTASNVTVTYSSLGVRKGTVTVSVSGFNFAFLGIPNGTLTLPAYQVSMAGESAGYIPPNI